MSVKGQLVNILSSAGHSVAEYTGCFVVLCCNKTLFTNTGSGHTWPPDYTYCSLPAQGLDFKTVSIPTSNGMDSDGHLLNNVQRVGPGT